MSIKLMSMVFERYGGPEMLLALAMADRANDDGAGIYQALSTLARKSRQSESNARRQIKRMLESGWLLRVNAGTGGRATPNSYQINPLWIKGVSLEGFPDLPSKLPDEGFEMGREPQSGGPSAVGNPSTAMAGNAIGNPSNLTPFPDSNPSTAVTGNPGERVSKQGVNPSTAVTPDSYETKNSDARAGAQARARPGQTQSWHTNPNPVDDALRASRARGYWRTTVLNAFLTDVWLSFPEYRRQPLATLPQRLQDLICSYALPIAESATTDELTTGERSKDLDTRVADVCRTDAQLVVSHFRSARAAA